MSSTVHIAIDAQKHYVCALAPPRDTTFARAVNQFAKDLRRYEIPTVWIAMDGTQRIIEPRTAAENGLLLGLEAMELGTSDIIATKGMESAFTNEALAPYLLKRGWNTLIFTGIQTTQCVAKTLTSALSKAHNFNCIVAYDLLADSTEHFHRFGPEDDPQSHLKALRYSLHNWADRPQFATAKNILKTFASSLR